ncbi:MAG: HAD family hydrolase [Nanoarchaeota archaeon]|nr:HAD family hydrolase [Nanoarchaeota archaeon]MBU1005470.1 HAD family hydrolase [Nanoarchaeota archaeon]MBU1947040.1 HAD family hydrolase [Nanoarchaeota archaeon]
MKAVLFDMDGVLIDSHNAWFTRFNAALEHFGFKKINMEEFDMHIWAINFAETVSRYFPGKTIDEVRKFYFDNFEKFVDLVKKMPHAEEALKIIKQKSLKLGVASNTQSNIVKEVLKRHNLIKYFDHIIGGEMVKKGKPDPEIILLGLSKMKMKPDEILFIGDTIYDKQAAEAAKVKFIGYKTDGDFRVDDLRDIFKISGL